MKATGIVRRVDDLGRIVIPKEIRRTLKIREGNRNRLHMVQKQRFVQAERRSRITCSAFLMFIENTSTHENIL